MQPHYLREYKNLWALLQRRYGRGPEAYARAVGGAYDTEGAFQKKLVLDNAPEGPFNLFDVGCGSGRAATALSDETRVTYFGVDILEDLLDYARQNAGRDDWRFEAIEEIALPVENDWADVMLFMSVFTHLKPAEIQRYLGEAARVLKPGGRIICSYLDENIERHTGSFRRGFSQWIRRAAGRDVMIRFLAKDDLASWMEAAGFSVEHAITYENGRQSTMIGRRKDTQSS